MTPEFTLPANFTIKPDLVLIRASEWLGRISAKLGTGLWVGPIKWFVGLGEAIIYLVGRPILTRQIALVRHAVLVVQADRTRCLSRASLERSLAFDNFKAEYLRMSIDLRLAERNPESSLAQLHHLFLTFFDQGTIFYQTLEKNSFDFSDEEVEAEWGAARYPKELANFA